MTYVLKNNKNDLYYASSVLFVNNVNFAKKFMSVRQAKKFILKIAHDIEDIEIYELENEEHIVITREQIVQRLSLCSNLELKGLYDDK